MRSKDGHYIGSSWIKRDNQSSRNNYCVAVIFLVLFIHIYLYSH